MKIDTLFHSLHFISNINQLKRVLQKRYIKDLNKPHLSNLSISRHKKKGMNVSQFSHHL